VWLFFVYAKKMPVDQEGGMYEGMEREGGSELKGEEEATYGGLQ